MESDFALSILHFSFSTIKNFPLSTFRFTLKRTMDYLEQFNHRLTAVPRQRFLNAETDLEHFALINYALPSERLRPHIHPDFELVTKKIDGREMALMSAVPFVDKDFCFANLKILGKYRFGQINFRVYVRHPNGQDCVWFLGTVLGSITYHIPRRIWKMPWHYGRFEIKTDYQNDKYNTYQLKVSSNWATTRIDLEDSGKKYELEEGFDSMEEMKLIMTQPIEGYYYKTNRKLGNYRIWHDELILTKGKAKDLYFQVFEDLGLLNKEEMQNPHSVWITPKTFFKVELPPS